MKLSMLAQASLYRSARDSKKNSIETLIDTAEKDIHVFYQMAEISLVNAQVKNLTSRDSLPNKAVPVALLLNLMRPGRMLVHLLRLLKEYMLKPFA